MWAVHKILEEARTEFEAAAVSGNPFLLRIFFPILAPTIHILSGNGRVRTHTTPVMGIFRYLATVAVLASTGEK